ncbi:MAG: hypothetical protein JO266_09990 [Acidobacteria bacterium]|nr:hypothetical protein [Acidobacteriota bacterium]
MGGLSLQFRDLRILRWLHDREWLRSIPEERSVFGVQQSPCPISRQVSHEGCGKERLSRFVLRAQLSCPLIFP